jgi:glycosyltransferase involved in cell wall biosynthesis
MNASDAPSISLVLATYEMPRHLELVLTALRRQSFRRFEILLCDDGSGPDTRKIVEAFRTAFAAGGITLTRLWQENRGFRKCRLLNEAIRRSRGELLVFLDGDCIPHRHFLRDHWDTREPGTYGAGRRVELSRDASESIDAKTIEKGILDLPSLRLLVDALLGKTEHWNRTIRWGTLPPIRALLRLDRVVDLKGCNFSVFRKDLVAINGFDEAYEGYGREDTDVEIRLQHSGLRLRGMKGIALQYHVWHERRGFTPSNDALLENARATRRVRCERGIEGGDASGIRVD